ncbi:MAG TPA: hypothetical protein VGY55_22550 [Pirellulales bacterium]|jgi:hypothetical protein|nr:hypothetical protein [Pirellulales bacterium]
MRYELNAIDTLNLLDHERRQAKSAVAFAQGVFIGSPYPDNVVAVNQDKPPFVTCGQQIRLLSFVRHVFGDQTLFDFHHGILALNRYTFGVE